MHFDIPNIRHASVYARTDMQGLAREILRMEGITHLRTITQDF